MFPLGLGPGPAWEAVLSQAVLPAAGLGEYVTDLPPPIYQDHVLEITTSSNLPSSHLEPPHTLKSSQAGGYRQNHGKQ